MILSSLRMMDSGTLIHLAQGKYSSQYSGVSTSGYNGEVYFYQHTVSMEYYSNGSCYPYIQIERIWGYITETDNFGGMFKYYHGAYTN